VGLAVCDGRFGVVVIVVLVVVVMVGVVGRLSDKFLFRVVAVMRRHRKIGKFAACYGLLSEEGKWVGHLIEV
jgi:hypothetical protein